MPRQHGRGKHQKMEMPYSSQRKKIKSARKLCDLLNISTAMKGVLRKNVALRNLLGITPLFLEEKMEDKNI